MMSWEEFKQAHPRSDKWAYKKYVKLEEKKNKPVEVEDVGIKEDIGKVVSDVKERFDAPQKEPDAPKIDFNAEVEAVLNACDANRQKIDRIQDIIVDHAVPDEALLSLEEVHIALGNVKALTRKMLASYKAADEGIALLESERNKVLMSKKKLAQIKAMRTQEAD